MKCFIISPIGMPDSPIRRHADDVYECVILPALALAGVTGARADHIKDVGRISEQMFNEILTADFCIGILKDFNPNVFYEVAVAHSAGIPVILLSEMGVNPPFDLKDERTFHYDLSPRPIHRGENPRRLADMIESVRRLDGERRVPFGLNLTPLNGKDADPTVQVVAETEGSAAFWKDLVDSAKQRLYIAGLGFTGWRGMPGMDEALAATASRGCEVRVMTMHGQNPATQVMINPDVGDTWASNPGHSFEEARSWFRKALANNPNADVRAIRKGMLYQQMIIVDDRLYLSPYLYSANTAHSPRIECAVGFPLFRSALREFASLWDANAGLAPSVGKTKGNKAKSAPRSKKSSSPKAKATKAKPRQRKT
jgi:hypothetical protein